MLNKSFGFDMLQKNSLVSTLKIKKNLASTLKTKKTLFKNSDLQFFEQNKNGFR